jgi:hypothetical protein
MVFIPSNPARIYGNNIGTRQSGSRYSLSDRQEPNFQLQLSTSQVVQIFRQYFWTDLHVCVSCSFLMNSIQDTMNIHSNFSRRTLCTLLLQFLLFLPGALFPAGTLQAKETSITDFTVSNSENQLVLYLTVTDCFTDDMVAAIHNGIPATFTFYVDILRKRSKWPDKKIKSHEFDHIMEYDSLKKEYRIQRNEKGDSKLTASLAEAKNLMSEINGYRILPLDELEPGSSYVVRVKAKLARKTLPLYFHYLIPFISLWDFDTKWHELTLNLVE